MTTALVVAALLVLLIGCLVVWWARSERVARWNVNVDQQWAEMQLEYLGREARAQMRRVVEEARREQGHE
jgi:hypothetical protein